MDRSRIRAPHGDSEDDLRPRILRVSPDASRLAFVRREHGEEALWVCELDGVTPGEPRLLSPLREEHVEWLAWSPHGDALAYVVGETSPGGVDRSVAWVKADERGEQGRVPGGAFDWSPKGALVVANLLGGELIHYNMETQVMRRLAELVDDGGVAFRPQVKMAPDGRHVAFTCRRPRQRFHEVQLVSNEPDGPQARTVTQIPGRDVFVRLFWSPKGRSLGIHVVHLELNKSAVIVLDKLAGDGVVIHAHERNNAPISPAWAPGGGRAAAFLGVGPRGEQRLTWLNMTRGEMEESLSLDDLPLGHLWFLDDQRLVVDGGAEAEILSIT